MDLQEGFGDHKDFFNFQLASLLNITAVLFLAFISLDFDLAKLVDVASWPIADILLLMGPLTATAFSLLLADTSSWLLTYDFGTDNEMAIYWTMMALTAIIQLASNGSSVLLLGLAALGIFFFIEALFLLPVFSLSNPVTMVVFALVLLVIVGPQLSFDIWGLLSWTGFGALSLTLLLDYVTMLITDPDNSSDSPKDLYKHGSAWNLVDLWKDSLLGTLCDVGDLLDAETVDDILDNFWHHLKMQVVVVIPLALVLMVAGIVIFVVKLLYNPFADLYHLDEIIGDDFWKNLAIIFILDQSGDLISWTLRGLCVSIIDKIIPGTLMGFQVGNIVLSLLGHIIHPFLAAEAIYWCYYLVKRKYEKWQQDTEQEVPQVGASLGESAGDIILQVLKIVDISNFGEAARLVFAVLALPVVQLLTWAFQAPFYFEMYNQIS